MIPIALPMLAKPVLSNTAVASYIGDYQALEMYLDDHLRCDAH